MFRRSKKKQVTIFLNEDGKVVAIGYPADVEIKMSKWEDDDDDDYMLDDEGEWL